MKFIIGEEYALRSYKDSTYALLKSEGHNVIRLKKNQFDLLAKCDGQTDINLTPELSDYIENQIVHEASSGEHLSDWQKRKFCDNPFKEGIYFRITGKCNFNCKHCFNAADMNLDNNQWTLSEINKLLDEAVECGIQYFKITGGEPMLHPDFLEIIRQIHKRKMCARVIVTNAYFLTQEILDELKKIGCNPWFYISFDCLGHHDWMRGHEGSEKRAIDAIKMCIKNGFRVLLDVQLNNVTKDTLLETALFFDKIGVQRFRIIRTSETPRWAKYAGDACLSIQDYFDECISFMKVYSKNSHKMDIVCWEFGSFFSSKKSYQFLGIRCNVCTYNDLLPVCYTRVKYATIGSDGTLYPCHPVSGYYDSMGWKLPNVKMLGLQNSLNSQGIITDTQITTGDIARENEKCKKCSHFKQCFGGCRTMSLLLGNGKYGSDPLMCSFYEGNYEQKMKDAIPGWTLTYKSVDSEYIEDDIGNILPSACMDAF